MSDTNALNDWPSGPVLPLGQHLQEGVGAIRDLAAAEGYDLGKRGQLRLGHRWLGKIVAAGPNGEANYTNSRYWVQRLEILAGSNGDGTDNIQTESTIAFSPSIYTVTNPQEIATGAHTLSAGTYVRVDGWIDEGGVGRWTMFALPPVGTFPVQLTKTGGSDGSKTTTASWTYTVKDLSGNTLGTSVAPSRPRPKGTATFQAGSTGYGIAFYAADGSLILWDAGEVPGTGGC